MLSQKQKGQINTISIAALTTNYVDGKAEQEFSWLTENKAANSSIIMDMDNDIVTIKGDMRTTINILSKVSMKNKKDTYGNDTYVFTLNATNEEEIRCELTMRVWLKSNAFQIFVKYNDVLIVYEGFFITK